MRILGLIIVSALMLSCERCHQCSYTDDFGDQLISDTLCGSKKRLTDFESDLESQWAAFGKVSCAQLP